jgi:hypothetical protein
MIRAIARLILLLILVAGCEMEKDPVDEPLGPSLHLSDGYCLVADEQVVLNHYDISHYDYGAHLIYLKDHISSDDLLEKSESFVVYAGGEEIYTMGTHPGYSSSFPATDPFIWTFPTFYEDYILAIDHFGSFGAQAGTSVDSREDPRIVKALKKYGQYLEGLHCEIVSCNYSSPDQVRLQLKLSNRDEMNYYYLDPEKMGMGLFHYFTNGLYLRNEDGSYTNHTEHVQPNPWDKWELDWMSLLKGGSSVMITLDYKNFDAVPPGTYRALFRFPGLSHVKREQLAQHRGQIWLGKLELEAVLELK